jgi:cobalt-zinc-cadmium resistance protein CzcA
MIHKLIYWATENRLVVLLLALTLVGTGLHAFFNVNVEAYPDPAPAIVEIIARYPGASAEEVERQVTIPLEIALAGMPGLKYTRSKSLFGLSHLRNQFEYGIDYFRARVEVLNRLHMVPLPAGVQPEIAPTSPTGEIFRWTIQNPRDGLGREIYTTNDLKSLEDWVLEKEFRRIPRIADVVSFGGTVKRYEIQPDPERLRRYAISLGQLEDAIADSNSNVSGDYMIQGHTAEAVRGLGLIGGGLDPVQELSADMPPTAASQRLREEENRRLGEIRQIVLAATNNVPISVGDVVDGGPGAPHDDPGRQGVVVSHQTRMGKVMVTRPLKNDRGEDLLNQHGNRQWVDSDDTVEGIVLLRKGEQSLPALAGVKAKFKELNERPGRLLPGVKLEVFNDRTWLINVTTETVRENLAIGMVLVSAVLLIFLNNVRSAVIVAINVPLSLLFAFAVLYYRGMSANLLSLGAVDFGIIVDSSVIMVESVFRYLRSGQRADLDLRQRIRLAAAEVDRGLLFTTAIMVCALLPLFTMKGPEGQIFGPMADTYAFALAGALLLAFTLSPMLCTVLFRRLKPGGDNFIVRGLKRFYIWQLDWVLKFRFTTLALFAALLVTTLLCLPMLGREFMPELEEGNVYIRATFPVNVSLDEVSRQAKQAMRILRGYPEADAVLAQAGRPDDGTDPTGFYNCEFFVPLKMRDQWPGVIPRRGWMRKILGARRPRSKLELIESMSADLNRHIPGVDWNFSQMIRDNVMETLSGVKGENSVKIFGPDLAELERLAEAVKIRLARIPGIKNVGIFSIMGQTNLEFPIDRRKCALWNVSTADVHDALATAVGGKSLTQMVEGERKFDVTLRWPPRLRSTPEAILDIPVDVIKNRVTVEAAVPNPRTDSASLSAIGAATALPSVTGSSLNTTFANPAAVPRRRLGDLVTPRDASRHQSPQGSFLQPGASTISREQGQRLIAIKFSVRGRDLAGAVDEAQRATAALFHAPYRVEWSGEFQEMQEAVHRLTWAVGLSLSLILVLLYLALRSALDAVVILGNVVVMTIGGIWALLLTGSNFNISAGVGFISILGVGIMNGMLLVTSFNQNRAQGLNVLDAVRGGVEKLVRPVIMTALAAIFGLLPAALSDRIGSETQRPLAIVVIGGMLMTALLTNFIPLLYSFYGDREPPEMPGLAHH